MSVLAPSRQRSSTIFGIALSELFILLLFLVIFLWIATAPADTPDIRIVALEKHIKDLEKDLGTLRAENAQLKEELSERDDQLKLLWELYSKTPVTLTPGTPEWRKWVKKWHEETKSLQVTGGRGHPNCLGRGGGPVIRLTLTDDGIAVQPTYSGSASGLINGIAPLRELISLGNVSVAKFEELGRGVLHWSESQKPRCRFDVTFVDKTTLKAPYAAALRAIDKVFYKTEHRG